MAKNAGIGKKPETEKEKTKTPEPTPQAEEKKETESSVTPSPEVKKVIDAPAAASGSMMVDRNKFYKLVNALVTNRPYGYTGLGGLKTLGGLVGCTTYQEAEAFWKEVKAHIYG